MSWLYIALVGVAGLALFTLGLFWFVRWLSHREPYSSFMKLRTRQKVTFSRLLLRDKGKKVPLYVKLILVVLVIYLSIPFDIVPDFIPVIGYLDDVALVLLALALVIKLLPQAVVLDLLREAQGNPGAS